MTLQAYLILLHFILLSFTDVAEVSLQIEGKTIHQQKECSPLYCSGLEPNPKHLRAMPVFSWILSTEYGARYSLGTQ